MCDYLQILVTQDKSTETAMHITNTYLKNDKTEFVKIDNINDLSTLSTSEQNGGHQTTASHL